MVTHRTIRKISAVAFGMFASALLLLGAATIAVAQDDESDMPCRATETGRALDFWMGSWEVTDGHSTLYGLDRIEWDASGCAIHEYWEDADGNRGTSLFYFSINEDTWHQVWIGSDTSLPWGLKIKRLTDVFEDGTVRFQGELVNQQGRSYLDRTTMTPNPDGTVRRLVEISTDGGETWRPGFDAIYSRAEN